MGKRGQIQPQVQIPGLPQAALRSQLPPQPQQIAMPLKPPHPQQSARAHQQDGLRARLESREAVKPQQQQQQQQQVRAQSEQPAKRVKSEPFEEQEGKPKPQLVATETAPELSGTKRQRQLQQPATGLSNLPTPARTAAAAAATSSKRSPSAPAPTKVQRGGEVGGVGKKFAWALSEVRDLLEAIVDVEGVSELLDRFPECVLIGGIAARREVVSALLGDHGVAVAAAKQLVAPNLRQPLVLELRAGSEDVGSLDGPDAQAWLQGVAQAMGQALGQRLKLDPFRLRLSSAGSASLDVVELPDACSQAQLTTKADEINTRHLGSPSNLLVCLEPGSPMDLCLHYDSQLCRTMLLGEAAVEGRTASAPLHGRAAAIALEQRFASLCTERAPQWLSALERLETRLTRAQAEAREVLQRESSDEVLRRARAVGTSFGRALEKVINGAPGCTAGALTLEEELTEYATSAAKGMCGSGTVLSAQDASSSAVDLFANFGSVEGYAKYLKDEVHVPCADMKLNGGAAWQRLLAEVEVAMRLAHPPAEELSALMLNAIRAGGTGVHGHVRWEDVASKLMLGIAFEPLRRRISYVASRVVWVLKNQKAAVSEWMSTLSDGPAARLYSPLFSEHLQILRAYPLVRDLVFAAFDGAVSVVGEALFKSLQGTLTAACINPSVMLRASTEPSLDPRKAHASPKEHSKSERTAAARARVSAEMQRRNSDAGSGGLPVQLLDRVFEPKDGPQMLPFVEVKLRNAFGVLAGILSNQAFAFSDTSLATLCRRQIDEAMSQIEGTFEQKAVLSARRQELDTVAQQVEQRLGTVRRCITALRSTQ